MALLLLSGCEPAPGAPERPPDIVFILIDTLRADHLSSYGYARETTPALDAFAHEAVVFENTVAQTAWTHPALISLFTSRYPGQFHETWVPASHPRQIALHEDARTLAEVLRDAGYQTLSVATNPYCHDPLQVMQGFEERKLSLKSPARWVVNEALGSLDARAARKDDRPLFLYLHFMDVHTPLQPPPPYDTLFPTRDGAPHQDTHREYLLPPGQLEDAEALATFRSHSVALYDGALRYVDDEIARLREGLRERGIDEDAIWSITADHGEAQWDHVALERRLHMQASKRRLGTGHGHSLLREVTHVPWILRAPGLRPARIASQVRSLDIAPTLLALADVRDPSFAALGSDLSQPLANGTLRDLPALSELRNETGPQKSLRDGQRLFLRAGGSELLLREDLRTGALEETTREEPDTFARMRDEVDSLVAGFVRLEGIPLEVPEDLKEQLKKLGYLQWEQSDPENSPDERD